MYKASFALNTRPFASVPRTEQYYPGAAIESARKLDFFKVAVLPEYVKSQRGVRYDLQIMVKRLHRNWGDF